MHTSVPFHLQEHMYIISNNIGLISFYFSCRRAYFYPYVDHLVKDMEKRFASKSTVTSGFALIPSHCGGLSFDAYKEQVDEFASKHREDLPNAASFDQELHTWYVKYHTSDQGLIDLPTSYAAARNSGLYPNIEYLLKVLLTIPVTSASVERANSTLKYIKSKLRSTMAQSTLNCLVLGYKHRDILRTIKTDVLVNDFATARRRRLILLNPISE